MTNQIIIIGAGAAGLMAAYTLSRRGKKVIVLEARERLGGRIHTVAGNGFSHPVEYGAEFIHGDLPLTLQLMKEACIPCNHVDGAMWHVEGDDHESDGHATDPWQLFATKLAALRHDETIEDFLAGHFSEEKYAGFRESVRRYASGYDTADPAIASVMALGKEWMEDDHTAQYRPEGGYARLVDFLAANCIKYGAAIHTGTVVKNVQWQPGKVIVTDAGGKTWHGEKVIVTVPAGVLQASAGATGAIGFHPALQEVEDAVTKIGMGAVIKVLLEFKETFWKREEVTAFAGQNLDNMLFAFSKEAIPTWWTQHPGDYTLLTGWIGEPDAETMNGVADQDILEAAISSLSAIFRIPATQLQQWLIASKVINWTTDDYCRGSYSYATVDTETARKILTTPIHDTIYFAGEALYEGAEMGTVEAALKSGQHVGGLC